MSKLCRSLLSKQMHANGLKRWLFLALVLVILDIASKQVIMHLFSWGDYVEVTSFFNIVRAHNTGAAFSFLSSAGGWQRWLFTIIALVVSFAILYMLWRYRNNYRKKLDSLSLALVLSGAIGNVVDRIRHGYVVDFLDFHLEGWHFPAFNLADSAITLGVICILLNELSIANNKHKKI